MCMDEGLRMQFMLHQVVPSCEGFKILVLMSSAVAGNRRPQNSMQQVCTEQLMEMTAPMMAGLLVRHRPVTREQTTQS